MKKYFTIFTLVLLFTTCDNGLIGLGNQIDIAPPKVTIGEYADGNPISNADYVKGDIILSGTVSDDIGVSGVTLTIVDTATGGTTILSAKIDYESMTWTCDIDTNDYSDGEKEINIEVLDTSSTPKKDTVQRVLYFDNTAPLLRILSDDGYTDLEGNIDLISNSRTWIKGEAYDALKIKKVSVVLESGSVNLGSVEGTNTWSVELSEIVTGSSVFSIVAEDFAGNRSQHFYHDRDISHLINGDEISPSNLKNIENGDQLPSYSINSQDLESIQLTSLTLNADMNEDVPVITVSNPENGSELGGNAIVIGRVEDDDAVDTSTLEINIDDNGWEWNNTLPETEITGSGMAVNFKYDISSLSNGTHTIQIRVEDDHGTQKISDLITFTVDLGAPQIDITHPDQGFYSNSSSFTISGTSYDDQSVTSVRVQIDGESEVDWRNASTSNGFSNWYYVLPVLDDGIHNVKVYAEDGTGKVSSYNVAFYIDTEFPVVNFNYPVKSSEVYGTVVLQGNCEDNSNAYSSRQIKIGKDGSWVDISGGNNWSYSIADVETVYNNTGSSNDLGGNIWQLPVFFKVVDIAGNVTETTESDYYILINGELDKPEVAITYPSNGFKTGGPVTIRGTSFDEQQVLEVEMQLDLNGDGDFSDQIDLNSDTDTDDTFENETQWYTVTDTLNWQQELNSTGELFGLSASGLVSVRVRAIDSKDGVTRDIIGDYKTIDIIFDNSYPYFTDLSHESFDYEKGTFTLSAQAHDTEAISKILISYNGGTSYTDITGSSTKISDQLYQINESVNSTSYVSESGVLPIRLKIVDNAGNSTDTAVNLNIDNKIPEGSWTGSLDDIEGITYDAQGTATDAGTVSGIEKIEVYFVRSGMVYKPNAFDSSIAVGSKDFKDGNGVVPYIDNSDYLITIDDHDELGSDSGANGDSDGYNESLTLSGSTYTWWAELDSTNIPDGVLDVHYVIYDKAGNARHYQESGFIKNNKPSIDNVVVGVDLDYSDVVDPVEKFDYSSTFNSQNRLFIEMQVSDDNIPGLSYFIYDGNDDSGTLISTNSSDSFDISTYSDGSHSFYCKVLDSDGIVTSQIIETIIDNTDDTSPTISIDELTQSNVPLGHLESAADSLFDNSPLADADVSGQVVLTGNAWDNQRIKSIKLTLDGIGTDVVLASWEGNSLVSKDSAFSIDSYSFSEDSGLLITWTYIWETNTVSNSAAKNTSIDLAIEDFASTPNTNSDTLQVDVVPYITSIVTEDLSNGGIKEQNLRSVDGKYSIKSGSESNFIRVNGYNLRPVANGARISSSSFKSGLDSDGITMVGDSLVIDSIDANYEYVLLTNDGSGSGYFSIIGGSLADPIPSINNINKNTDDNGETQSESGHDSLTDDRYFRFFDVTSTSFSDSFYPNMMMEGDSPVFGFIQGGASNDLQVRKSTNDTSSFGLVRILAAEQMAMARDDDGVYHYASVNNFNQGRIVYIYDQFETTTGYTNGGATSPYWSGYSGVFSSNGNNNAIDLDSVNYSPGLQLGRYLNLQMDVKGSSTNAGEYSKVYMAWYDNYTGEILFRNFRIGESGGSSTLYGSTTSNQGDINSTSGDGSREVVTTEASSYLSMGVTDDDYVVVVYYNQSTGYLNLVHSTAPVDRDNTSTDIIWSAPQVLNLPYTGWYVSMYIDTNSDNNGLNDSIHIAAYDTVNADLRYIYLDSYADTNPKTSRVDAVNSVGIYTDIKVNNGTPYIAYYNNSENGTRDSIKLAQFKGDPAIEVTDGAQLDGIFTGNWEVYTVPVNTPPQGGLAKFMKVNIDFNSSGDPVVGYSADTLEYSVPLDEL